MATQENVRSQNSQSRGQDLKSKMKNSAEKGGNLRAEKQGPSQGQDQIKNKTNPESKNPSPEESGE